MEALGYSAVVEIQLFVAGEMIEVSKTGRDRITLAQSRELAAGSAELVITVDGVEDRSQIVLQPQGGVPYVEAARATA